MEVSKSPTTITTEKIKQICVQLGFYRNPICNEKLYLHHKGFEKIEAGAFDPYTDVKVLWLESNALTSIPCGKNSRSRPKAGKESEASLKSSASYGCSKSAHVDCYADWTKGASPQRSTILIEERKTDVDTAGSRSGRGSNFVDDAVTATLAGDETGTNTRMEDREDVFTSLYPTLRQLYLHNNALREMPDLSGFQRLDTVNLSSNCIRSVQANCDVFNEKVIRYEEELRNKPQALLANSKSMQRELRISNAEAQKSSDGVLHVQLEQKPDSLYLTAPMDSSPSAVGVKMDANGVKDDFGSSHVENLELWRRCICSYAEFCPHNPLEPEEDGKLSDNVPPERRNPCSSIRSLNLSGNYLTSVKDIVQLLCYKNLATLDLSHNRLEDGEALLFLLERLPRLRSLKLSCNPLVRTLPRYRKTVLSRCVGLMHLDDRPVFASERRLVTAWASGGEESEKMERARMKKESEDEHIRRLQEFREMVMRTGRFTEGNGVYPVRNVEEREGEAGDETAAASREPPRLSQEYEHMYNNHHHANGNDEDDNTSSESDTGENNCGNVGEGNEAGRVGARFENHGVSPIASIAQRVLTSNTPVAQVSNQQRHAGGCDINQFIEDGENDIYIPSALS